GPNWITTVANTKVNEWEELVFDANLPSIEGPNLPAKGHVYARVVLFFDFGTAGTGTETISYFDDICVEGSAGPTIRTVNFEVNMNNYSGDFDKVYVSGTFNNWAGDANALTDSNADGIWVGSIDVPVGLYEYKITLDNWLKQEEFKGTEECTVTDPSGQFTNRKLLVGAPGQTEKFCFNSCYLCGEEVKITFRLGMGSVTPNPDGVWLSGGGNFEDPGGRYKMKLVGDHYEVTAPRKRGFKSFYAFANGPCGDYSCKEDLIGQACANPGNFNDRYLPPVSQDTVLSTCYALCTTNTDCVLSADDSEFTNDLFSLLANPASEARIYNNGNKNINISMVNAMGQLIHKESIAPATVTTLGNSQFLPAGLYIITARSENKIQSVRWAKP
ncbi:MAG TPA: T9SS type A sorting domain-containing protein, partial [Saprospiraceae bacterium]|nr:T9SS type A sorting domain-containing protein [Saprospiraceae bacterium]